MFYKSVLSFRQCFNTGLLKRMNTILLSVSDGRILQLPITIFTDKDFAY